MIIERTCFMCGKPSKVEMPQAAYDRWTSGLFIQEAWPDATPDEREAVLTGIHPDCWGPEEDE